jgi:hypothetical protein
MQAHPSSQLSTLRKKRLLLTPRPQPEHKHPSLQNFEDLIIAKSGPFILIPLNPTIFLNNNNKIS